MARAGDYYLSVVCQLIGQSANQLWLCLWNEDKAWENKNCEVPSHGEQLPEAAPRIALESSDR